MEDANDVGDPGCAKPAIVVRDSTEIDGTVVGFKLGRWVDTVLMRRELGAGSRTPPAAGREAGGR